MNKFNTTKIITEAPFKSCHAASIVEGDNKLLVSFFAGTREGKDDNCIWVSDYINNKWTKLRKIAESTIEDSVKVRRRLPTWNPVLFKFNNIIFNYYKVGLHPQLWWGVYKTSIDNGLTWSKEKQLPPNILGPIKNKPIISNGIIISPSSTETQNSWNVHFEISRNGINWDKIEVPNPKNIRAIQPTILKHANALQAICRTGDQSLCETWSYDNGNTWTDLEFNDIISCNSGIDAVTLSDGRHILIHNYSEYRWPIHYSLSKDGKKWSKPIAIEEDLPLESSYPAVIESDKKVHIVYTWGRMNIKHTKIKLNDL